MSWILTVINRVLCFESYAMLLADRTVVCGVELRFLSLTPIADRSAKCMCMGREVQNRQEVFALPGPLLPIQTRVISGSFVITYAPQTDSDPCLLFACFFPELPSCTSKVQRLIDSFGRADIRCVLIRLTSSRPKQACFRQDILLSRRSSWQRSSVDAVMMSQFSAFVDCFA